MIYTRKKVRTGECRCNIPLSTPVLLLHLYTPAYTCLTLSTQTYVTLSYLISTGARMRTILELVQEAATIHRTEECGDVSADGILAALVALEVADRHRTTPMTLQAQEPRQYRPADREEVRAWVAQFPRLRATAADVYRSVYGEEPTTADARTVAAVLRDCGMVSARSGGKLVWRHPV